MDNYHTPNTTNYQGSSSQQVGKQNGSSNPKKNKNKHKSNEKTEPAKDMNSKDRKRGIERHPKDIPIQSKRDRKVGFTSGTLEYAAPRGKAYYAVLCYQFL